MNFISQRPVLANLFLLALTLILLLTGLSNYDLRRTTEPRAAGTAVEMLVDHDFVLPKLNGQAFLEKPPLYPWLASSSFRMFGISSWSARLPSVMAATLLVLFLFWALKRKTQDASLAFTASVLLISTADFWGNARQAGQDTLLALGVAVGILGFYLAHRDNRRSFWLLFATGLAIATLAKGILGLAFIGVTVFFYLAIETLVIDKRFVSRHWLYPAIGILIGLVPLGIWLFVLYRTHGWDAFYEITWVNSVGRFMGHYNKGLHNAPAYYYLMHLPATFQPWSLLVYLGLWHHLKQARQNRFGLLLCCWLIAPFIMLSISSGKRPVYLLSLYPVAAILAGSYCMVLYRQIKEGVTARSAYIVGIFYAVSLTLSALYVLYFLHKQQHSLVVLACVAVLCSILLLLLWQSLLKRHLTSMGLSVVVLVIFALVCYGGLIQPDEKKDVDLRPLFETVLAKEKQGYQVVLFQPSERLKGATLFYTRHTLPEIHDKNALLAYLRNSDHHLALTHNATGTVLETTTTLTEQKYRKHDYRIIAGK